MWVQRCFLAIVLTIVTVACNPVGVGSPVDQGSSTRVSTAGPPRSDLTYGEQFAERLPAILAKTSEFQKTLLEDGVVTAAEHERAQLAYIACIEDAGVTIVQLERTPTGLISLMSVGGTDSADALDDVDEIVSVCDEEYYSNIDDAYRVALNPDDTDSVQLGRIIDCVQAQGVPVGSDFSDFSDLLDAAEAISPEAKSKVIDCNTQVQQGS